MRVLPASLIFVAALFSPVGAHAALLTHRAAAANLSKQTMTDESSLLLLGTALLVACLIGRRRLKQQAPATPEIAPADHTKRPQALLNR